MKRVLLSQAILTSLVCSSLAGAQTPPAVPDRQVPPTVVAELRALQHRFESALAQDCAPERCFPKGCTYGQHSVADRPQSTALPGLAEEKGPGSVPTQEYLTLARCTFAHERSLSTRDARALVRRLQTKLSAGWTVVEVSGQRLQPISAKLRDAPEPPKPEVPDPVEPPAPPPEPPPPVWELPVAMRELWVSLLPHFSWMIAVIMGTVAAMLLIWGWRRLGRISPEEQAMLSQMSQAPETEEEDPESTEAQPIEAEEVEDPFVGEQRIYWIDRFADPADGPDADIQALIAQWLRAGELGLLSKAVLTFPESFPSAFPDGGEYAESKLRFSEYLRDVDEGDLPSELIFYTKLKQHALSASLARHSDAKGMASLRADFGAAGLVRFIAAMPARYGAILYAHASVEDQFEASRLLSQTQVADLAEQLLQSNRMSRSEAEYVVALLAASESGQEIPAPPRNVEVSDQGTTFEASAALSILLPLTESPERSALLANARDRFGGTFPGWYKDILYPQLLVQLNDEARADLLLEVEVQGLAGWLSVISAGDRDAVLNGMSSTLHNAIRASSVFNSRAEQLDRSRQGRLQLASALHKQLARSGTPFETLMV